MNRVEVLDRVKNLLLLPNTEFATTKQVAEYFEVDVSNIERFATRNKEELESDGYTFTNKSKVLDTLNGHAVQLETVVGKTIVTLDNGDEIIIPNRGLRLFPRRAILRVGMSMTGFVGIRRR
jgi:hypothetical protein